MILRSKGLNELTLVSLGWGQLRRCFAEGVWPPRGDFTLGQASVRAVARHRLGSWPKGFPFGAGESTAFGGYEEVAALWSAVGMVDPR